MRSALEKLMADQTLGPIYADHPTARSAKVADFLIPYVVYIDGVGFDSHDTIIGDCILDLLLGGDS